MSAAERALMATGFIALGVSAAIITLAWLRDRLPPHDPHAEAFGDMPRLPDAAVVAERLWS